MASDNFTVTRLDKFAVTLGRYQTWNGKIFKMYKIKKTSQPNTDHVNNT